MKTKAINKLQGFTLVELLVVLTLVTIMGGFVGPNIWKQYSTFSERNRVQDINQMLMKQRRLAYAAGKSFSVNSSFSPLRAAVPEGWELLRMEPIYFLPSGVTNGGNIELQSTSGIRWRLHLSSLDGQATIERL